MGGDNIWNRIESNNVWRRCRMAWHRHMDDAMKSDTLYMVARDVVYDEGNNGTKCVKEYRACQSAEEVASYACRGGGYYTVIMGSPVYAYWDIDAIHPIAGSWTCWRTLRPMLERLASYSIIGCERKFQLRYSMHVTCEKSVSTFTSECALQLIICTP